MRRIVLSLVVMATMASAAKADMVRTEGGAFMAPAPGEEIPNAGHFDPVTGLCVFDVGTTGPTVIFDGDACKAFIDPDTTTSPRRREAVTTWPGPLTPPVLVEPSPAAASTKRSGSTKRATDLTPLLPTPEDDNGSRSGDDDGPRSGVRNPRYNVGCPRAGVKMWGNARLEKYEWAVYPYTKKWKSWLSLYAKNKFYVNLYNSGIGSIEPYTQPQLWATWFIQGQDAYYRDGWRFWNWLGFGPIANGSSQVSSFAGANFGRNGGLYSTQWVTVSSYRDLVAIPTCNFSGPIGPGNWRTRCRSRLGVGFQNC